MQSRVFGVARERKPGHDWTTHIQSIGGQLVLHSRMGWMGPWPGFRSGRMLLTDMVGWVSGGCAHRVFGGGMGEETWPWLDDTRSEHRRTVSLTQQDGLDGPLARFSVWQAWWSGSVGGTVFPGDIGEQPREGASGHGWTTYSQGNVR